MWISQPAWASLDSSTVLLLISRHEPRRGPDPAATAVHREVPSAHNALACAKASLMQCVGADQGRMNGVPLRPDMALPNKKQRYAMLSTIEQQASDQRVFPA